MQKAHPRENGDQGEFKLAPTSSGLKNKFASFKIKSLNLVFIKFFFNSNDRKSLAPDCFDFIQFKLTDQASNGLRILRLNLSIIIKLTDFSSID
jgi:hypothetical protein